VPVPTPKPSPTPAPSPWGPCVSGACCNPHTTIKQTCPDGSACQECGGGDACQCPNGSPLLVKVLV
jgi:hypothetical protein